MRWGVEVLVRLAGVEGNRYIVDTYPVIPGNGTHVAKHCTFKKKYKSLTCMTPLFAQVGTIKDEVKLTKIVGDKDFGLLLKERFKNSIPGLDTMMFRMKISRNGKLRKLQYSKSYYAPSISKKDIIRISDFAKDSISWEPGIVIVENRWIKVSSWVFVYGNPELIYRIDSISYFRSTIIYTI